MSFFGANSYHVMDRNEQAAQGSQWQNQSQQWQHTQEGLWNQSRNPNEEIASERSTVLRSAQMYRPMGHDERIVEERSEMPYLIGERVLDEKWKTVTKPYVLVEKSYEVPQVVVKETVREVMKPEIVERVIEVPKIEQKEIRQVGPPRTEVHERVIEIPQVVFEERVVHVPKVEYQDRIFEIPVPEFRETIEYDDRIEYREVCVDKIVEVPEIEYRIKEVEKLIPQTYVQEGKTRHSYVEFPIAQVQEVQRNEVVPQSRQSAPRFGSPQASQWSQQASQWPRTHVQQSYGSYEPHGF